MASRPTFPVSCSPRQLLPLFTSQKHLADGVATWQGWAARYPAQSLPCHAGSLPSKAELRLQTSTRYLAQSVAQIVQRGSTALQQDACLLLDTDLDSIQPALVHKLQVTLHAHTQAVPEVHVWVCKLAVAPLASCFHRPCVAGGH